ncbi:hypothetical protein TNCV_3870661 [Trichonephila clavipes]|nr:hypothetical protein TNCV_3870661 [Trichonephila clavipes]
MALNSKRKRDVLNIETKLKILNRLAKGESGASLAKFYDSVEKEGYSRDDVYHVDETGVNRKAQPRKSLASKRESTATGFKVSKKRVTAMVCLCER